MTAIFLDLDGTLTDPKPGITGSIIHALEQIGMLAPEPDALEWAIGPPLLESFRQLGTPDPDAAMAIYRERYGARGLFDCRVYDGVPGALQSLSGAGHRLFLATAKPHVFATRITAHFGLDRWLESQFGPELDGTRRDKGDLLAHALGVFEIDPASSIMVGDRSNDLAAAGANGMRFVGALWGYGSADELESADALCAQPLDLAQVVAALSA